MSERQESTLDEFGLIAKFFSRGGSSKSAWPSQGVGDDCAFLDVETTRIAVTADMMALGTHFLDDADPYKVGRKALAVNLSDLAAAGATPEAFFLSLAIPRVDQDWLEKFSEGLYYESNLYECPLRGGDTTKSAPVDGKSGKTVISICAMGELPMGQGMTRSGARPGDDIWVSGTPGDAYAALGTIWKEFSCGSKEFEYFKSRMDVPTPRVELGQHILGFATACCDISDGLVGDLKHILDRSGVSARLDWDKFPMSDAMRKMSESMRRKCILGGGDDYELIFCVAPRNRELIEQVSRLIKLPLTRIGEILPVDESFTIVGKEGETIEPPPSFNHFA